VAIPRPWKAGTKGAERNPRSAASGILAAGKRRTDFAASQNVWGVSGADDFFRRAGSHGSTAGRMPAATPVTGRFGVDEWGKGRLNFCAGFVRGEKRWRATALQDAGALTEDHRIARSVLECASPLALWTGVL
jgi:hypothetical protein